MRQKQEKLETKMKWMLLSTMIPMAILIIVLLLFFWHYTNKYNQLSNNLAVSAEYNANFRNSNNDMSFKDEVDMDIYYVTIGRKGKDDLPTEQVKRAIDTVEKLKKTTEKEESLRSLKYLTNYLKNLQKRMNQLLDIKDYQQRQEFMANNTEILTTLFEKEMQNYIYQEATQLVQVESQLAGNVRLTILTMCAAILIATCILMRRSFRLTYSITKPISEILHNIKKVGKGEYKTINKVPADCIEIQELDAGTRKMAGRIEGLLENVRKEQDAQHLTELQLLQAQVNPHFLYNTLDTINWKAIENEQYEISGMVGALADILRYTVKNAGGTASISEEIAWLKQYIMLQSAKFGKRLDVKIYMPEDVKECRIHKLLLQPFVENTIKYAFADQEECALNIRMKKSGEQLHILIQDNGQGMDPDMVDKLNQDECEMEGHLGIANVRKRLKLYYGGQAALYFESEVGNYTKVHLFIPIEEETTCVL